MGAAKQSSRTRKIVLSLAVSVCAASIAGLGTYATFTSTTSASQTVTSGTVVIALGATGAASNRLTVNASNVVPGDTMQRSFTLANTGTEALASIVLTTTATTSSLLDSDATAGLQMVIQKCSVAWVEAGVSPSFVYSCAGTTSTVLASRAVIGSSIALSNLSLTAASTDQLRLTLTFPSTAGNTLQGLSSTIQYSFVGTQRAATDK